MNIITNNTAKCSMGLVALLEVLGPEIGLNVVDLGLIYQFDPAWSHEMISEEGQIFLNK